MKTNLKALPMDELSPLLIGIIESGKDVTFTVTGNSMRPLLHNLHDTVLLTMCDKNKLQKYDIPLYRRENGQYVLHRIVKIHRKSCTYDTVGDAQTAVDRGIPFDNTLCVVKGFTRYGKYHDCTEKGYRIYSVLWCAVRILRPLLFGINSVLRGKRRTANRI